MFKEADFDCTGFLEFDELFYVVTVNLGAEISEEDLVELMMEIDQDKDAKLSIDEFIAFMNVGSTFEFD